MNDRQIYECEVVELFRGMGNRRPAMSDQDVGSEYEAARIFYTSLEHFVADVERAAALSDLRHDQLKELLEIIRDYTPMATAWEEQISNTRRGYDGMGIK